MKKNLGIAFSLIVACLSMLLAQASFAAWNADWPHRTKITLNTADDGAGIKSPVESVPVLVRLHTGNFAFADANEKGADLRFIAADDKTPLKYHIEKFDGLNELALVWVQVPKLTPNAKTDFIWLYYGNAKAAPGDEAKATYDAAQIAVLHLGEKEGAPKDSTANGNNASTSTASANSSGLIGGDARFDGGNKITLPATPSLQSGANGMSVSMWIKPADATQNAMLFSIGQGANALSLVLQGDKLMGQLGTAASTPAGTVSAAAWHHVALTVKDGLTVYLDGAEVGKAAAPNLTINGEASIGQGYKGEIDEVQIASTARPADWIKAAAAGQGEAQKLIAYGAVEGGAEEGGTSYFSILLGSVTLDGWVVIGILMVMMVISVFVMVTKTIFINKTVAANNRFKAQFAALLEDLTALDDDQGKTGKPVAVDPSHANSSLYRMYHVGVVELRQRIATYKAKGRDLILSSQSMEAIRASIDACSVRETQRLNGQMVLLTISIAGGPFLGLLGTVVGVMITFAAIAAAGDVNVNAIAPGIAAALVATVAGLAVAIPSLFGYNYFASKIGEVTSDMQVFVDEFITKVAENYSV